VTLAHGSPRNPVWEYILDTRIARTNFAYFETPYCFIGHTHLPIIYHNLNGQSPVRLYIPDNPTQIQLTPRAIANPGSVGQPRDRDTRASYALYDPQTNQWDYRRVEYPFAEVQIRILEAGLPHRHALRLAEGW